MRSNLVARIALAAGAACAVVVSPGAAVAAPSGPDRPPAIQLEDERGAAVSLDGFTGQVVLLDVWASWCAPCRAAFPEYDGLFKRYRSRGFHVLAVNVDERREDATRFLAALPHDVQVAFDPVGRTPKALQMRGMPTSYLVDRRGRIRFVHEGFTGKSLDIYRREIEQLLQEAP